MTDGRRLRGLAYVPLPGSRVGLPEPLLDLKQIHRDLDLYADAGDRLRVLRIEMSSPGGFNFEGLGEVVEQVRELIRDLSYRNRQKRIRGELEIIREYLDLRREHSDAAIPVPDDLKNKRYLADLITGGVQDLRKLEADGKLAEPAENVDYEPPAPRG